MTAGDAMAPPVGGVPGSRSHVAGMEEARAGAPSRFEQFERAVCDLPPGSTGRVRPAAVANLLGAA